MSLDAMDAKECTICESELDEEVEIVTRGYIGIIPVAFCCTCGTGILDMADQREEIMEEWEGEVRATQVNYPELSDFIAYPAGNICEDRPIRLRRAGAYRRN